mgnify:FL=1|jgi:hypothetical protein|tara:strand:+ start:175 stop:333 length:159 start_codon:yes stop_codon:yes gene_type:complete
MTNDRNTLNLTKKIEELEKLIIQIKQDNYILAKENDRLNEYIQIMELENVKK